MKRLLPLLIACLFVLSACVRSETQISVLPGDLITFDIQVRLNRTLAEQGDITPETLAEDAKKRIPEDAHAVVTINQIDEPDWIGTHVSTLPLPANQYHQILTLTRESGTLRLEIPTQSIIPQQVNLENLKQFGAAATLAIHMPGQIIEANGEISERTVRWDLTNPPETFVVVCVNDTAWTWWIAAGVGGALGILLILIGLIKWWRRRA